MGIDFLWIWWTLILASFPASYLAIKRSTGMDIRTRTRSIKYLAIYLLSTFLLYVFWLLNYRTGNDAWDLSPLFGYSIAMLLPWLFAIKKL
jgi:hypothetical protein